MNDLLSRKEVFAAIGFERCGTSCETCGSKCDWYFTVKNIPATNQWVSCEKMMPETQNHVFAYNKNLGYVVFAWYHTACNVWRDNANDDIEYSVEDITHWMSVDLEPPEEHVAEDDLNITSSRMKIAENFLRRYLE